jgi:transcriptional regulator with AAA-type ATPase domain
MMSKFLGRSYTRTGVDLQDKGEVQAAVYRYLEHGNVDELKKIMNEPWAQTKEGQKIISDMLAAAQSDLSGGNVESGKHSYEISNWDIPGF